VSPERSFKQGEGRVNPKTFSEGLHVFKNFRRGKKGISSRDMKEVSNFVTNIKIMKAEGN